MACPALKAIPVINTAMAEEKVRASPRYDMVSVAVIMLNKKALKKPYREKAASSKKPIDFFDYLSAVQKTSNQRH